MNQPAAMFIYSNLVTGQTGQNACHTQFHQSDYTATRYDICVQLHWSFNQYV